jgi:ferrous iron transport protein A
MEELRTKEAVDDGSDPLPHDFYKTRETLWWGNDPMERRKKQQKSDNFMPSFSLAMAGEGETVRIISIRQGCWLRKRLMSMGIQVKDIIIVSQRLSNGAVLISKDNQRFAIGGGMALKIIVTKEE